MMPKEERDRLRHDLMASDKYSSGVWKLFDTCDELEAQIATLKETIEVLSDNKLAQGIAAGIEDIKMGRLTNIEDIRPKRDMIEEMKASGDGPGHTDAEVFTRDGLREAVRLERAAALQRLAEHVPMIKRDTTGVWLICSCGMQSHIGSNWKEWWRNHIAALADQSALEAYAAKRVAEALDEASVFCPGCAKNETVVVPPRSGVVGLAAVHSNGMICIPNTVRALLKERAELERATTRSGE